MERLFNEGATPACRSRIHIELTPEARRRYPNAVVRARRIYFPHAIARPINSHTSFFMKTFI
jgi:hypothetical protein